MDVIEKIGNTVTELCKERNIILRADLSNPEICILIEVCKSIAGISLLKKYSTLCKLNIKTAAKTNVIKTDNKDNKEEK